MSSLELKINCSTLSLFLLHNLQIDVLLEESGVVLWVVVFGNVNWPGFVGEEPNLLVHCLE